MNFIMVSSFDNYIDANIILGKLQHEGITCFLRDEYTVTIDPILTNAISIKKVYHCFTCGFEFDELPDTPAPAFSPN